MNVGIWCTCSLTPRIQPISLGIEATISQSFKPLVSNKLDFFFFFFSLPSAKRFRLGFGLRTVTASHGNPPESFGNLWTLPQTTKQLEMKKRSSEMCVSLNFTIWIPWYEKFLLPAIVTRFQASAPLMTLLWLSLLRSRSTFHCVNMASSHWHESKIKTHINDLDILIQFVWHPVVYSYNSTQFRVAQLLTGYSSSFFSGISSSQTSEISTCSYEIKGTRERVWRFYEFKVQLPCFEDGSLRYLASAGRHFNQRTSAERRGRGRRLRPRDCREQVRDAGAVRRNKTRQRTRRFHLNK